MTAIISVYGDLRASIVLGKWEMDGKMGPLLLPRNRKLSL